MTDYDDEMNTIQKSYTAIQGKLRLLWGILRVCRNNGWNEEVNLVDWLTHTLEAREKDKRELSWKQREEVALDCLRRVRVMSAQLEVTITLIQPDRIMLDGPQHHLNDAQDLLLKINENIKFIYDARQGLTK